MKKKIQIYSLFLGYGGIEREVVTLANSLVSLYDVELIFLNKDSSKKIALNKKIKLTILGMDGINLFNSKTLKDYINNNESDVVISTSYEFNKYLSKTNRNKIYWEHNHHDNTSLEAEDIRKKLYDFNKVIVPNNVLYNFYKSILSDVYVIPNMIDCDEVDADYSSNNIIFVGKLEAHKGVDELIDVFSEVFKKNNNSKLYIVGEGSMKKELLKRVVSYKLEKNVLFMGALNRYEVCDLMSKSSIFVSCSKSESFGIAVVDAMNSGLACVVYDDVYSFNGIIDDEINGYLIKNRSKVDMVKIINYLLDNKNEIENIGLCAKEKASLYDVNKLKNEWIKII